MTADEREEDAVVVSDHAQPTRWDAPKGPPVAADPRRERGGLYIAILAAIAFPFLIASAVVISNSTNPPRAEKRVQGSGLDEIVIAGPNTNTEANPPSVEPQVQSEVEGTTATAPQLEPEGNTGRADEPTLRGLDDGASLPPPTAAPDTAPPTVDLPTVAVQPSVTVAPISTVVPRSTIVPITTRPTTTTSEPVVTSTPTTAAPASTTTTTATPDITLPPDSEPATFAQRIDIGEIGETFLRFRFAAENTSGYSAIVRQDGAVVSRTTGSAPAGQTVNASFNGLLPGTDYTVQVTLDGPPATSSPTVPFRTSGGAGPAADIAVQLQNLRLAEVGSTRVRIDYESNVCANGSFRVREEGGDLVGTNSGQEAGCTTRHLAIPGFWTPALKPNTTYIITVAVEANGRGLGDGNTESRSLTVTTSG